MPSSAKNPSADYTESSARAYSALRRYGAGESGCASVLPVFRAFSAHADLSRKRPVQRGRNQPSPPADYTPSFNMSKNHAELIENMTSKKIFDFQQVCWVVRVFGGLIVV